MQRYSGKLPSDEALKNSRVLTFDSLSLSSSSVRARVHKGTEIIFPAATRTRARASKQVQYEELKSSLGKNDKTFSYNGPLAQPAKNRIYPTRFPYSRENERGREKERDGRKRKKDLMKRTLWLSPPDRKLVTRAHRNKYTLRIFYPAQKETPSLSLSLFLFRALT